MKYLHERAGRSLELAKVLERTDLLDARDFANEVYFGVNAAEHALKEARGAENPATALTVRFKAVADDTELWNLLDRVEQRVSEAGPSAVTEGDVLEAFLIQRRLRRELYALLDLARAESKAT
jgi:hypothetical protein